MRKDMVEELYETCAPIVYKYLLCLTHDAHLSEDLTSETFERTIHNIEKFRSDCRFLCGCVRLTNDCIIWNCEKKAVPCRHR